MRNSINGTVITLRAGEYSAQVASVGGAILSLERAGRALLLPPPADSMPVAFEGKVLAPWPNRIRAGHYSFEGMDNQLAINELETGCALHGLVAWQDWEVTSQSDDKAAFSISVPPQPGYPYAVQLQVTYTLSEDAGLVCIIAAQNVGDIAAPYGASTHPFLTCNGAPIDRCMLLLPASRIAEVDQNLLPTTTAKVAGTNADFRTARLIGADRIDNAFTELPPQEWNVDLIDPDTEMTVRLTSDVKWVQIYSGEKVGRVALAVEPMTCPPDAFNTGVDLIVLQPGDLTSLTFSIKEI